MGVRLLLKVVWAISVSWPVSKVSVLIVCWVTETCVFWQVFGEGYKGRCLMW